MTASSSRGTFSPAEPTEDRVIPRYITRPGNQMTGGSSGVRVAVFGAVS
jgi:hypothetical protein